MAFINWNESFSVNVPSMDEQHKKLVTIINELHEHQKQGKSKEIMQTTLVKLVQYTVNHFTAEEKIMEDAQFPGLDNHRKSHQKLIASVSEYVDKFKSGESIVAIELMKFLQGWLLKHISQEDMEYGKHITKTSKATASV